MTFIASVVAKKGVAIIADSLVTTLKPIISSEDFFDYVEQKTADKSDENVRLSYEEIAALFKYTTSHTSDFEEKLFRYDEYTAISSAGAALINNKKIEQIVDELVGLNSVNPAYIGKSLEGKVKDISIYLENEVRAHLKNTHNFAGTSFIFTNYDARRKKTTIYRIDAKSLTLDGLEEIDCKVVDFSLARDDEKVVCDGQSKLSERILYGNQDTFTQIVFYTVAKIFTDFNIVQASPKEYAYNLILDEILSDEKYLDDIKAYQLSDLSLQQAIDLAYLLMKIEVDIQKYTENIPTVGGVIKVAVIDDAGFRFIAGNDIQKRNFL